MPSWNFEDFLRRLEAIKEIGSLDELVEQVPGLAAILEQVEFRIEELEPIERILRSMTLEERLNPQLLDAPDGLDRRRRIAQAAGTPPEAVDDLIAQFQQLRDMLERASSPEEVTREVMDSMEPGLEAWQTPADAWKGDAGAQTPAGLAQEEVDHPATPEPTFDECVDRVLDKINASGLASLTPAERAFLDEASQRYRVRRGG